MQLSMDKNAHRGKIGRTAMEMIVELLWSERNKHSSMCCYSKIQHNNHLRRRTSERFAPEVVQTNIKRINSDNDLWL